MQQRPYLPRQRLREIVKAEKSQLHPHSNQEAEDSLSRQVEPNLLPRMQLRSIPRLFVLLRILFQDTLRQPVKEFLLLFTESPALSALLPLSLARDSN